MATIYINRFVFIVAPFLLICCFIAFKLPSFTSEYYILLLPFFALLITLITQIALLVNRHSQKKLFYSNPIVYKHISRSKNQNPTRHLYCNIEISESENSVSIYNDKDVMVYIDMQRRSVFIKKKGDKTEIKFSDIKYISLEFDDFFYLRLMRAKELSYYLNQFSLVLSNNNVLHLFDMTNLYNSVSTPYQGDLDGPDYYFEKGKEILYILSRVAETDYALQRY